MVVRAFTESFQHFADITDILKMCMKEFDAEKNVFKKLTGQFTTIAHSK